MISPLGVAPLWGMPPSYPPDGGKVKGAIRLDTPSRAWHNRGMNKNTALATMITAYQGRIDRLAEYMIDYCDDPAIENSPDLITAMETLTPDDDITTLLEAIMPLNPDLGNNIAASAELCRSCYADIEVCDC
jgi:hypothetical protein